MQMWDGDFSAAADGIRSAISDAIQCERHVSAAASKTACWLAWPQVTQLLRSQSSTDSKRRARAWGWVERQHSSLSRSQMETHETPFGRSSTATMTKTCGAFSLCPLFCFLFFRLNGSWRCHVLTKWMYRRNMASGTPVHRRECDCLVLDSDELTCSWRRRRPSQHHNNRKEARWCPLVLWHTPLYCFYFMKLYEVFDKIAEEIIKILFAEMRCCR